MDKTVTHILKRPEKLVMPLLYIRSIKRIGFGKLHQIGNGNVARFGKNSRTYRDREEIEKYSHLATLQEVADNDYNLNIPRYVDTFEEEEPIDIKAVMSEIKELEAKRAELDKEIDVYLKELGIIE